MVLLYVLTMVIAGTASWIEVLNAEAGGILPNREYYNGDPAAGVVKWRYSSVTSEKRWREYRGPRDEDGNPATRPLNAEETARMHRDIAKAKAGNSLRDVLGTLGQLQYPLVLGVVIWCAAAIASRLRDPRKALPYVPALVIALMAGALAWHRAYFTSLGL